MKKWYKISRYIQCRECGTDFKEDLIGELTNCPVCGNSNKEEN